MDKDYSSRENWIIEILTTDMPFSERLRINERLSKMESVFHENNTDPSFHGVEASKKLRERMDKLLSYRPCAKLGRLSDGVQRDHGTIVHAVPLAGGQMAFCGTSPGKKRSVGWSSTGYTEVTCEKCLKCIDKLDSMEG